jgi:hypothetical protein
VNSQLSKVLDFPQLGLCEFQLREYGFAEGNTEIEHHIKNQVIKKRRKIVKISAAYQRTRTEAEISTKLFVHEFSISSRNGIFLPSCSDLTSRTYFPSLKKPVQSVHTTFESLILSQ